MILVDHHEVVLVDPEEVEAEDLVVLLEEDILAEISTVREMILPTGEIPMPHLK